MNLNARPIKKRGVEGQTSAGKDHLLGILERSPELIYISHVDLLAATSYLEELLFCDF